MPSCTHEAHFVDAAVLVRREVSMRGSRNKVNLPQHKHTHRRLPERDTESLLYFSDDVCELVALYLP